MIWLVIAIILAIVLFCLVAFVPLPRRKPEPEVIIKRVHHYSMRLPDKLDLKMRRK